MDDLLPAIEMETADAPRFAGGHTPRHLKLPIRGYGAPLKLSGCGQSNATWVAGYGHHGVAFEQDHLTGFLIQAAIVSTASFSIPIYP